MLPEGFPKWRSVYNYWQIWNKERVGGMSVLDQVLKKIGAYILCTPKGWKIARP
jgi:hypothetical protein